MKTNQIYAKKIYTMKEVADLLGVHINTIKNYQKRGWLTGVKAASQTGTAGKGVPWQFTADDISSLLVKLTK